MTETVPLHYREQGEGAPLIVLHGLYGSGNNWKRIATTLENDHRLYLVDLRNHGQSPHHPEVGYTAMAADLLALMEELELEQADVLGHSMGGKVAMTLALQHPERIRRLVVADVSPVTYPNSGEHERLLGALQRMNLQQLGSRRGADHDLESEIPSAGIRQFLLTNLEKRDGAWQWRIPLDILSRGLETIRGFPDLPGSFAGPALFLYGENSDYVRPADHDVIRKRFPEVRFQCMAGCGHWLHAEDPEAFVAAVSAFLDT
ncbi:MAG: alpha/beta fold hydrolase [Ectothiorhodospiraceae bacterium]|nr:alpha/beta fold hydrolase [Ectothiorhodospiraceae bacterium]MCH8505126.1 alpha/beta fold hydrolase [Ectothiorhodospiraceae bacterium]